MKKIFYLLLFSALLITGNAFVAHAQGIHQLWGMTTAQGRFYQGTIFTTTQAGRNPTKQFDFNFDRAGALVGEFIEYSGEFYATAVNSERTNQGILFKWNPVTDEYKVLHEFKVDEGTYPNQILALVNNKIYGTTIFGGYYKSGVIFEFDPATGIYSKRSEFGNILSNNSGTVAKSFTLMNGKLYGTATPYNGSGILYEWDPISYSFTKVNSLPSGGPGAPFAKMVAFQNKLYGVTVETGTNKLGEIIEWDPATNIVVSKVSFTAQTGSKPWSEPLVKNGKFYGMTSNDGAFGAGTLYEWDPVTNMLSKKVDLPNGSTMQNNSTGMALVGDKIYGIARANTPGNTFIFEWDPNENVFVNRRDFVDGDPNFLRGYLTLLQGKLFGIRGKGNYLDPRNELFEWDPATNAYTKKIEFNVSNGRMAMGSLTYTDGKLFGMTSQGGQTNQGTLFEFDPGTSTHRRMQDFDDTKGTAPQGKLLAYNGRFYGMTPTGGANNSGTLFEWQSQSNTFVKKFDFGGANGSQPFGSLVEKDGKLYGMTAFGGANDQGVIFEWDPGTNSFAKKVDFVAQTGGQPHGDLLLNDGKFYGMTYAGGQNSVGVLFEWDPATNIYTKRQDLSSGVGAKPFGSLVSYKGKLYGVTSEGGAFGYGALLEWDRQTNNLQTRVSYQLFNLRPNGNIAISYDKFYVLSSLGDSFGNVMECVPAGGFQNTTGSFGETAGAEPYYSTLIPVPAPISKGVPGQCTQLESSNVTVNNFHDWVPIVDRTGNAVAEVRANGNELGTFYGWLYVHDGLVRRDSAGQYYLDRTLTLTPTTKELAPGTHADVRYYIRQEEYDALVAANNADPQAPPINDISQIGVFRAESDVCSESFKTGAYPIPTTVEPWVGGYVFTFSVNSFSTFYLANKDYTVLPVKLVDFTANLQEEDAVVSWQTAEEVNFSHFELQRSLDGKSFGTVASVEPNASSLPGRYGYIDANVTENAVPNVYYRLKMIDLDGSYAHSAIVSVALPKTSQLVYPNPAREIVRINLPFKAGDRWQLVNSEGTEVQGGRSAGGPFDLNVQKLPAGTYLFRFYSNQGVQVFRVVKN